jgi:hypothetical protein
MHRMTEYLVAGLVLLGGTVTTIFGELVNEEIRGWLDYLPRAILRLAARRLDPVGKVAIYEDEWLPELIFILRGAEARPISRLIIGVKFSVGLLIQARRIARHLHRSPSGPAESGVSPVTSPKRAADLKTIAGWAAIALIIWWVIEAPTSAAHVTANVGTFLATAGTGITRFFASV